MTWKIYPLLLSLSGCAESMDCGNMPDQQAMNHCSAEQAERSQKELAQTHASLMSRLDDEGAFQTATQAWLAYQQAHCESVAAIYQGGSFYRFAKTQCETRLARQRLDSLQSEYQDTLNIIEQGAP